MSTGHDAHGSPAHDAGAGHDEHAFDGEPTQVLPPDEPETPGWVPALGLALFVVAGVVLLAGASSDKTDAAPPPATAVDAAPRGANAAPPPPQPGGPQGTAPAGAGDSAKGVMTVEQREMLAKRIAEWRKSQDGGAPPPPSPGHP